MLHFNNTKSKKESKKYRTVSEEMDYLFNWHKNELKKQLDEEKYTICFDNYFSWTNFQCPILGLPVKSSYEEIQKAASFVNADSFEKACEQAAKKTETAFCEWLDHYPNIKYKKYNGKFICYLTKTDNKTENALSAIEKWSPKN